VPPARRRRVGAARTAPAVLVTLLIVATYCNGPRVTIAGFDVLVEQLVLLPTLVVAAATMPRALLTTVRQPAVLWLTAYVGWNAVVSVARSPVPSRSLAIVVWLCLDLGILVVVATVLRPAQVLRRVLATSATVAVLALLALVAARQGLSSWGVRPGDNAGFAVFATAHEANILAAMLALPVLIAVSLRKRLNGVVVLGLAARLFAIAATQTRAAILALVAGLTTLALLHRGVRRTRAAAAVLGMAWLVVLVLLANADALGPLIDKFRGLTDRSAGTGQYRLASYRYALDELRGLDHLIGFGTNSFPLRVDMRERLTLGEIPIFQSNLFLQLLYDTGVLGVLLFAGAMRSLFRRLPADLRPMAIAVAVAYSLLAVFTSPLWFGFTWVLMGVLLGVQLRLPPRPKAGTAAAYPYALVD
jgi:hypothetical protein